MYSNALLEWRSLHIYEDQSGHDDLAVGIQLLLPSATQAAPAGGGGARLHHRHRLQDAEDDQGQVQVGREGRGLDVLVLVRLGAEAQDPLVAGDADRAGEAAVGGRPHADRTQGLRTLNECCETNCAPSYMSRCAGRSIGL